MCPPEFFCASDDFQFILCDTEATIFSDLVLGCLSPIHPSTTMIDVTNEREPQYVCEYLFTRSWLPQYQWSGTVISTSITKVLYLIASYHKKIRIQK